MNLHYNVVKYKNKKYAIISINYKNIQLPTIIDYNDINIIKRIKKKWNSSKDGFISCSVKRKNKKLNKFVYEKAYLHEIILRLKHGVNIPNKPIIHINNIGLDNRRSNLIYDNVNKNIKKNIKKKKRTIKLPKDSGIDPINIPTYVWYMKPNKSHGERFMVSIGNTKWKTTSSKKLSLSYKLEEAKLFLRQLKKNKPDLFENYSMNGDYTKLGKKLLKSYYDIIHLAGYTNIVKPIFNNKTKTYIKKGNPTHTEKLLLKYQGNLLSGRGKNRRTRNNLPKNCNITSNDLPKHCYYKPESNHRGGYFVVENHPNQNKRTWQTTSSKGVSIENKYKQVKKYLNELEDDIYISSTDESSSESEDSEYK